MGVLSHFGNVPADVLAGAIEKLVAKMDETELASAFRSELSVMPDDASGAFVEAMFDAFRDRGESSEDAVEGAGTTLDSVGVRDGDALARLVDYAHANPGVLKEAVTLFVEQHPEFAGSLPETLRGALARRLADNA
jgi:ABC-type transporter Mla subunit MlaD